VLSEFAVRRRLDTSRWTLARTDEVSLRKLSAAMDVKYRRIDVAGFTHSAVLILVDSAGRIVARTEKMATIDPGFQAALRKSLLDQGSR
jgi:protein SCO1/2